MNPALRRTAVTVALVPLLLTTGLATSAEAKVRKPTCERGYQWTRSTPGFVETSRDEWTNKKYQEINRSFSASQSGTVEVSASASIEVETSAGFGAFSAGVKAQLGVTASQSITVDRGTVTSVPVPARRRTVVRFGVSTRKLSGWFVVDPNNLQGAEILFEGYPLQKVPGMPAGCSLRSPGPVSAVVPVGEGGKSQDYKIKRKKK